MNRLPQITYACVLTGAGLAFGAVFNWVWPEPYLSPAWCAMGSLFWDVALRTTKVTDIEW